jgi:competence protein ComEA
MMPLAWAMKRQWPSNQQIGLSILIFMLLVGWTIHTPLSSQGVRGHIQRRNEVIIQVRGMVNKPGVYVFNKEPSLRELVTKAGGLGRGLIWKEDGAFGSLAHGMSLHIGSEHGYVKVSIGSIPAAYRVTLQIPISLNTATIEELDAVPEIGPALASRIIKHRSRYGPFVSVEELKDIHGVGEVRYARIRSFVTI